MLNLLLTFLNLRSRSRDPEGEEKNPRVSDERRHQHLDSCITKSSPLSRPEGRASD